MIMTSQTLSPAGQRSTIAIVGNRNAGKSTLFNRLLGQDISITSAQAGTTTDAVSKAYELIPVGAVTFYDTAGLDDEGELGKLRIKNAENIIKKADIILYIIGKEGLDGKIEEQLREWHIRGRRFIPVFNFADSTKPDKFTKAVSQLYDGISVSAKTGAGIEELKDRIIKMLSEMRQAPSLLEGLINKKDTVILVTPIDAAAPKGRLILPQVQVLRECLDMGAITTVVQPENLKQALSTLKNPPALVITDSQAVKEVAAIVNKEIPLTTFSMLYARAKWNFQQMVAGSKLIAKLKDNSKILIAEGCSHHITCNDIGRIKIPALLKKYTGKELNIEFATGNDFPEDLSPYELVIHCGGCMLHPSEISYRLQTCINKNIPITNYGMVISLTQGILERVAAPLL